MAQKQQSAKSSPPAPRSEKRRPPDFVCRARKRDRFGQQTRFYQNIGVAWSVQVTDKESGEVSDGFAVKLEAMPTQFDGSFILLRPKKTDEANEVELEEH